MDRRRAAGALLALVACIASTAAAPTASEHTSLDLYDGKSEGCYYNFQHYGEGDRIMTNEPCLNCTCHNRMLMCYLRVCPFTKAIGQDCTVEKRADQCCPIVTCPDVPVDLLTSTSTTSPAEYGGTGVGKVDNYGCTINGKYFPEGSKVPPTPNKPCEHCYCIRNMTTCVMQECTLHVDGCTPIYHKDVCCPVRYFCDHPDDEMPLLNDMTTTERPTQGFLLTTTTEEPTTVTQTRRECVENDQLYPDGALIKTEKPCVHCYCMKGDIVCVVQECGTPMENEGKNCTSLPPREGQCCPDTYICEGDELTTELNTDLPFEDITTMQPPRRVSIEGSGYRNEPDELPYTETPTTISEIEGSGEEQEPEKLMPHDLVTPEQDITTEGVHLATPSVTRIPLLEEAEKATTEPDKGLNTVPSGFSDEDSSEPSFISKTTRGDESRVTEPSISDQDLITSGIIEEKTPKPSMSEITTLKDDTKASVTEPTVSYEQGTAASEIMEPESSEPSLLATISDYQPKTTEPSIREEEQVTSHISDEDKSESSISESTTLGSDENKATELTTVMELTTAPSVIVKEESTEPSIVDRTTHKDESEVTVSPVTIVKETVPSEIHDEDSSESTETPLSDYSKATEPTIVSEQELGTTKAVEEATTLGNIEKVTEPAVASDLHTISSESVEESSSEPSSIDETTSDDGVKASEPTLITEKVTAPSDLPVEESTAAVIVEEATMKDTEAKSTESPFISDDKQSQDEKIVTTTSDYQPSSLPDSPVAIEEDTAATTEPAFRKEDESNTPIDTSHKKEEKHTTPAADVPKETDVTSDFVEPSILQTVTPSTIEQESKTTTTNVAEQGAEETVKKEEPTTESFLELHTFAHITESDKVSTLAAESEIISTTPSTEKLDLPLTTTVNPEENEIDEDVSPISSPGRIPGEGDCLLNGITYKNDSAIPSANKCHSGCRCVSSIVKCDPIICSPPPEYMDNCQLTYDTPNSCCPTYICDHSKETIPPQPHSQMSGTESPIPSFECDGDQCEVSEEKQPPILPSDATSIKPGKKPEDSECGSESCGTDIQIPVLPSQQPEDCIDGKCDATDDNCVEGKCEQPPITDQAEITPSTEDKIPNISTPTCEGESCTTSTDQICDKEGGCVASVDIPCDGDACELKPQVTPVKDEPKIPETTAPPCEGQSCTTVKEQLCNKEDGCEIFDDKKCEGEHCESKGEIPPVKDVPQICDSEGNCKTVDVTSEPAVLPCDGESCDSKPEILPSKDVPQICENGDNCKETKIPDTMVPPCEGDKCEGKPEILPTQDSEKMPEACANEDDCKQTNIPVTAATPCEGDACTITDVSSKPEISKEDEICSEESGCKKLEVSGMDCTEDSCRRAENPDIGDKVPSDCTSPDCMQQEPILPSQETTDAVTIITESPIMEQTSVSEPAQKPATQQGEIDNESPGIDVTEEQSVPTEIPDLYVTQHEDKITNLPEQIDIDTEIKPSESPDFESPSTAKIELETKTEDVSTKVPEIVTDQPSSDSSVIEEKMPEMLTEEPVIITELPEAYVTGAITQDSSTSVPFEDTVTEKQSESMDHFTLPTEEDSPKKESEEPTDEQNILTETPHDLFTEKPEEYATEQENISTELPQYVGEQEKLQTESPESPNIHVEEGSGAPEISIDEPAEKTTLAPKISETETEGTTIPEINPEISRTTESPLEQNEDETSTEIKLPELGDSNTKESESGTETPVSSETSQEPEIYKTTESPNLESQEVESSEKPEAYTPKTQEIATETPLPAVPESQDDREQQEMSEVPTKEEEIKTESPVDRITEAEQPFTNALDQSNYDQKTTGAPELETSEQDIETSTKNIEVFEIDKATKAPETFETEEDAYTERETGATQPEEYELKPTARIPTEPEPPSETDATKPQDIGHMEPQYDAKTELPLSPTTSYEEITTVPELSVTSEEKIMTESPLSLVTKAQLPDATTEKQVSVPELHETKTETPVLLSTVQPEIPISGEVTKTDMPETHITEHHETVTDTPDQQSTEQEMGTKSPEQQTEEDQQTESPTLTEIDKTPSPTVLPQDTDLGTVAKETERPEMVSEKDTSVTELEEKRTEASASTELLVTELPEISTKEPHEFETKPETEYPLEYPHEKTSTEIPVPTFTDENLIDTKVTDASESSVMKEYETGTTVPEQAGEEDKMKPDSQENIPSEEGELVTKLPELGTTPEEKYIESSESGSEKPEQEEKLPEDNEIVTKIPDSSTETPVYVETTPESAQKPETNVPQSTESFVPDQELNTEAPAEVVTKEQEIDIESPESHVSVSEIVTTESPEQATTKLEEMEVTETPVSLVTKHEQSSIIPVSLDIETEKSTTESSVSEQEEFTQDPNKALSKPQESEIKTEEPISEEVTKTPEIPSSEEDMLTVLPVHKETVQAEAVTPEQEDLGTTPSNVQESEHDMHTEPPVSLVTGPESIDTREPESTVTEHEEANIEQENYPESTGSVPIETLQTTESPVEISTKSSIESEQTSEPQQEYSETTPYLVELQQHTHRISDETSTVLASEEPTTASVETQETKHEQPISEDSTDIPVGVEMQTESSIKETEKPEDEKEATLPAHEEPSSPVEQQTSLPAEDTEKLTEPSVIVQETTSESTSTDISDNQKLDERFSTESQKDQEKEVSTTSKPSLDDKEHITVSISSETEKPLIPEEVLPTETEKEQISSTARPLEHDVPYETTAPEEEFIPATITKATTVKAEEEITTLPSLFDKFTKPEQKPSEILPSTSAPDTPKPGFNELQPTDEVPSPEDDVQFPPSGGYGQDHESDYGEEDQAFGPGTCRYGGKVYVSAQQIPRDDPCDFCFCFRSDIICLQQSCPPPIHGCHEEPIQGFCCPRYECPVSMATSLNVTTTTTTTTTTLPPHFLPHAYKGAAQRRGCQIKGHTYKVGEVVRASSGPCLHCTCGGDGQMKCDPKACTPEPMLRQMIAAAVSAKRRR